MNDVLFNYLDKFAFTYLDDIFIYNKTLEEYKRYI
jgi:hypothetical protein